MSPVPWCKILGPEVVPPFFHGRRTLALRRHDLSEAADLTKETSTYTQICMQIILLAGVTLNSRADFCWAMWVGPS